MNLWQGRGAWLADFRERDRKAGRWVDRINSAGLMTRYVSLSYYLFGGHFIYERLF